MEVFQDTKIYIFCPPNSVSGGPDALHQLCYYMNLVGLDACMVYFFSGITKCQKRFEKYGARIISYQDIEESEKNIIIMPESSTCMLRLFHHIRKCIWWLSYGFYDGLCSGSIRAKKRLKNFVKRILNIFKRKNKYQIVPASPIKITDDIYNFCGSKYAYDKLKERGYTNVEMLVEPLSLDFIKAGQAENLISENRSDVVLYNPAKPSVIMKKLLKRHDIQFQAIQGMSLSEIIALFRRSKLYIDFGEFGGPERLPKESVYNGTCLLVGKRNAAINEFDVAIPEQFKIEDYENEEMVANKIKDVLTHYDEYIIDFEFFRQKIGKLEENFINTIQFLFKKSEDKSING